MRKSELILERLHDLNYWRPPSFTSLMKVAKIRSKNGMYKHLQKLKSDGLVDNKYKPTSGRLKLYTPTIKPTFNPKHRDKWYMKLEVR